MDVGRMCWAEGSSARQKSFEPCFPVSRELLKVFKRRLFRAVNLGYTTIKIMVINVIHST